MCEYFICLWGKSLHLRNGHSLAILPPAGYNMVERLVFVRKSVNWNLRGCPRGQCVRGRFGIVTPLGTARYRYLSAVGAVKLEFAAPKPSPLGKVAERKRGRMRISHFAEMLVDIEHCTALIRLAFGDPPSPKGKALVRQITIFITVMVEGPKGCAITTQSS